MILEILKYRLVCDLAAGSAEVAPRPEMATPVTFAKFWELHLNAMRRAPFDTSNDVADRDIWYLDEQWTCSLDKTPETICTPSSLQTCRMMVRIRSRNVPSRTL
jgi:hypothetical protein